MGTAIAGTRFDGPGLALGRQGRSLAVYVHFPWCLAKCPYCDFVSYASPRETLDHEGYANAVLSELERRTSALELAAKVEDSVEVGSIFFGGGTPSLWAPSALGRVLNGIHSRLPVSKDVEVTVECNPTSIDLLGANALHDEGVNRLSIGAQALRPEQLKFLGRLHDASGALRAIEAALASRVKRVSADMIFGLPEQSPADARDQAEALVSLGLSHLSAYQLTIEPGTKFGELARVGRLPRAEDGVVAEAFLAIESALSARGLAHYEISNYAVPGQEARHNLAYWHGDEYLGLGCGAYGFLRTERSGVRYRNPTEPRDYVDRAGQKAPLAFAGDDLGAGCTEPLDAQTLLRERIMLGLRLSEGFDLGIAAHELGVAAWTPERERAAAWLVLRQRLERRQNRLRIPEAARLWADDTAARLF
jgi:putative oxygen-independent coproporphyrinogen III oxidase